MILSWLKILIALALIIPRGYLLVYVIDRSKNFSLGFKFFVGWVFGLAAFTLDIFASTAMTGFPLAWWIYAYAVLGQIIGLEFVIFLFERKLLLPDFRKIKPFLIRQKQNFSSWSGWEKLILAGILVTLLIWFSLSLWQARNFGSLNDNNLTYQQVLTNHKITKNLGYQVYPLNDSLIKVWLQSFTGDRFFPYLAFTSLFYYLIFILIFYNFLHNTFSRASKLLVIYFLSNLPLIYFDPSLAQADLLATVFLFITLGCFVYSLMGFGNSYFYISGIAWAFLSWTKNSGLVLILPLLIIVTSILWLLKKRNYKAMFIYWFFAILTISPWLSYIIVNKINVFDYYFRYWNWSYLINGFWELLPLIILLGMFIYQQFFGKIRSESLVSKPEPLVKL